MILCTVGLYSCNAFFGYIRAGHLFIGYTYVSFTLRLNRLMSTSFVSNVKISPTVHNSLSELHCARAAAEVFDVCAAVNR